MARPTKDRIIEQLPEIKFFKPAGVPAKQLETVEMTMEEVEALRLKDVKGLTQAEAAEMMKISRPTFQRVLTSARQKAADALTCGKAIRFEGGDYRVVRPGHCPKCGKKHKGHKKHHHGNKKSNSNDEKKNK
ncbi:DUF134 domain-containing protein [Halanaerobium hydrogeniformans]|uniref:UPF0251 protein Halsa_2116 n=1 Tax=Halanaerobium hydrogeniformans TaxID=656519 RepID=E4RJW2_HALHG|nr:DUF134 domain-containing protein [Halanaerobium hydrogeniformans]ADQ15532.1 protein of unknown function DUF134 [Halanaerobium hydrogeniformans]